MIMSNLIDQHAQSQKVHKKEFIQKLKFLFHQQIKKYSIIFTTTQDNSRFHYYTFLDTSTNPSIQLYWIIHFSTHHISIEVTYSAYRTLGIPIVLDDLRTKIQINCILRLLNKSIPYFLTFSLNQKSQIMIGFDRSFFNQADKNTLMKSVKSIVNQMVQQTYQALPCLLPFLSIPIENHFQSFHQGQKNPYQNQQFNLIKLKNTFDRFRKNRQKTVDLVYEQKDINKIRKKIQSSTQLLCIQLKSLNNIKYVTKQIRTDKLLQAIQSTNPAVKPLQFSPTKVDKIAYQFQIINIQDKQRKCEINANSQIYLATYNYRIFKTLIEQQKIVKSQNYKKKLPQFQQKDIIEQRVSKLVKKKPIGDLSIKALKNQISFVKFMRNQICIYIANYFLPLDNNSNELYIEHYQESLLNIIQSQKLKSFSQRLEIMINLLRGLKFISEANICHRDIKPSNIMINEHNQPKIIDFGSSISANNQKVIMVCNEKLCSTQGYHYEYDKCDEKIKFLFTRREYETHSFFDVYSYGAIIQKVFEQQMKEYYQNNMVKDTLRFIVQKCKQQNPDNRLSYDEILCMLIMIKRSYNVPGFGKSKKEKIL